MTGKISAKSALVLFLILAFIVLAQTVWWIIYIARLTDEKVAQAQELGASVEFVEELHQQEISSQIMVGSEGVFFLVLVILGSWLIYRALVNTEKVKFKEQNFLLAVTHELKTPLASIRLGLDTLSSEKIPVTKRLELLPDMREDTIRLERIVDDVLQAARFDQKSFRPDKQRLDFSALVNEVITFCESINTEVPQTIEKNISSDLMVNGDESWLRRAVMAVLENSQKYHDGESIRMKIRLTAERNLVKLELVDRGIGLTPTDSQTIFDRFYRVGDENTRRQPGSGLGLYLAHEVVKAHGGKIAAASDGPGQGSRFTITLPLGSQA